MDLIVAEKPNLAADIAKAIGSGAKNHGSHWSVGEYIVAACVGHLLQLAEFRDYDVAWETWRLDALPIIPASFRKKLMPDKKQRFEVIRGLVPKARRIIHAGDPDREGALIVDEVLSACGVRPSDPRVLRLWLHAQTPEGIRAAMQALKPNATYASLSASAEARARADQLIGFNMTRGLTLLWRQKGHDGVCHVGRVKTPTICMVVAREEEIANFKPQKFFIPKVDVEHARGSFRAAWVRPEGTAGVDGEGRLIDVAVARAVVARVQGRAGRIAEVRSEEKRQPAPLLYSLSDLQKAAGAFGLTPQQTLDAAQALYDEHKVITYPRTSCAYAPVSVWRDAAKLTAAVRAIFGQAWPFGAIKPDHALRSRAFDDAKLAEHFAIVPTGATIDWSSLSETQRKVFTLIARSWLAQFLPAHRYTSTAVEVAVGEDLFRASGTVAIELGWRALFPAKQDEAEAPALPPVAKGDPCRIAAADVGEDVTRPPARFTPATLLEAMKDAHKFVKRQENKARLRGVEGIGTEATRAAIIEAVTREGYVSLSREGKRDVLVPTPKGIAYYRAMPHELREVDLTAYFEGRLEDVAAGKATLEDFAAFQRRFVEFLVKKLKDGSILAQLPSPQEMPAAPQVRQAGSRRGKDGAAARRGTGSRPRSGHGKGSGSARARARSA